jgi:hypothetical protein
MDVPIVSTVREVPTVRLKRPFSPGMHSDEFQHSGSALKMNTFGPQKVQVRPSFCLRLLFTLHSQLTNGSLDL